MVEVGGEQGSGPEEVDDLCFHTEEFSPRGRNLGLKDRILAIRWNLGLEDGIWTSRLGFGPRGWGMALRLGYGFEAGIWL